MQRRELLVEMVTFSPVPEEARGRSLEGSDLVDQQEQDCSSVLIEIYFAPKPKTKKFNAIPPEMWSSWKHIPVLSVNK